MMRKRQARFAYNPLVAFQLFVTKKQIELTENSQPPIRTRGMFRLGSDKACLKKLMPMLGAPPEH
ncbi:hypothetical protein, partial [Mesorhizobium sp. M7A.F.Ca.CA.001.05.1.1]|uniref:hypothetical protein n=1 Tax=Mesorhizobium sp. M7A.F.Ca.CA.001.05.1.1 TaxID=2496721 RepID=UPI0019D11C36